LSATATPVALCGPLFETVRLNVTGLPRPVDSELALSERIRWEDESAVVELLELG
jgi:hypothetical protein